MPCVDITIRMPSSPVARREVIRFAVTGVLGVGAGCASGATHGGESPETPSPAGAFDPSAHVDDWQEGSTRGGAEAIEIEVCVKGVAKDAVQSLVMDRLDRTTSISFGIGRHSIRVYRELIVTRDRRVRGKADVSFDRLVAVTPATVTAIVTRDDTEETCEFPVYVEDIVLIIEGD